MLRPQNCYPPIINSKLTEPSTMLASQHMPQIPFPVCSSGSFNHKRSPIYPTHLSHYDVSSSMCHPIQQHNFFTPFSACPTQTSSAVPVGRPSYHLLQDARMKGATDKSLPGPAPSHDNNSRFVSPHQIPRLPISNKSVTHHMTQPFDLNSSPHTNLSFTTSNFNKYKPPGNLDKNSGIFDYTMLEGQKIACFNVGGEKRLCLPQVLHLLPQFNITQINEVIEDLGIICSRCNTHQLTILKEQNVLPLNVNSCGLITKSDAERLCKTLLYRSVEKNRNTNIDWSISVRHNCFGKQRGFLMPDLYTSPEEKCIECEDCNGLFAPEKFVGHSHNHLERKTCHWGFDSANWRHYLMLVRDESFAILNEEEKEKLQDALEAVKLKFNSTSAAPYKRKFDRHLQPSIIKNIGYGNSAFTRMKLHKENEEMGAKNDPNISRLKTSMLHLEDKSDVISSSETSHYPCDYSPNLAVVNTRTAFTKYDRTCQGKSPVTQGDQMQGVNGHHIADVSQFNGEDLNTIESRIIRSLVSMQNLSSGDKDFLLSELNKLRHAYLYRIHSLTADKKDNLERLAWLSTQNEKLEKKNQRLSKKKPDQNKSAGDELDNKESMKLIKLQAKNTSLKKELQLKTTECQFWQDRYNHTKSLAAAGASQIDKSSIPNVNDSQSRRTGSPVDDGHDSSEQNDCEFVIIEEMSNDTMMSTPPILVPSSDENEQHNSLNTDSQQAVTVKIDPEIDPSTSELKCPDNESDCSEAFLNDLPQLHRHKPYNSTHKRKKERPDDNRESDEIYSNKTSNMKRKKLSKHLQNVRDVKKEKSCSNKYLNLNDRMLKKKKKKKRKFKLSKSSALCISITSSQLSDKQDVQPPRLEKADSC